MNRILTIFRLALGAILLINAFAGVRKSFGDVLHRKEAVVALGFGKTVKNVIDWTPCKGSRSEKHPKPPFWVSKGDDCTLKAQTFGLKENSTGLFVARNVAKISQVFPDVNSGDVIDYQNDKANSLIVLKFGPRSMLLPYSFEATSSQQVWNMISTSDGFANINKFDVAQGLLSEVEEELNQAADRSYDANFIVATAKQLFRIKERVPRLSTVSHSSLLRLAYLRTTLDRAPDITGLPRKYPGCDLTTAQDITISNGVYIFKVGDQCGIAFNPKPYGETLRARIENVFIEGGTQLLDGATWEHDTFVSSRIRYQGGPVSLQSVLFVNCTFEVPDTPRGDRVVDLAISRAPNLQIGYESGFRILPAPYKPSGSADFK